MAGAGFFVGEKVALLLSWVGFGGVEFGPDVLASFGIGANGWMILMPLALHSGTVALYVLLRRRPMLAYSAAVASHLAYNGIVIVSGGGL